MELEATQAASLVLGMPSSTSSHSNEYHGAWDAVALAKDDGLLTMCADGGGKEEGEAAAEVCADGGGKEEAGGKK